jgi:signal peptidase I
LETGNYFRLPGWTKPQRNDVMVFNYPSGDTAIYDPRVPNGLMGHDYHGVLIDEAMYFWFQSISQKNPNLFSVLSLKSQQTGESFDNLVLDTLGNDFIENISYWKNVARTSMAKGVTYSKGGMPEKGLPYIEHGGLIYRPVDKRENYIKRCVAIAGDWVELKGAELFVNNKKVSHFQFQNMQYNINDSSFSVNELRNLGLSEQDNDFYQMQGGEIIAFLTKYKYNALKAKYPQLKIELELNPQYADKGISPKIHEKIANLRYFPKDVNVNNTVTDFTRFQVPYKGKVVDFRKENIAWYRRIITAYEGHKLEERKDGIYIDGKKTNTYKIQMNYYWLMGDNRYNSADSRVWGFVPEDHVVGKASIVWFSKGSQGIRWDRVFNVIR